MYFKMNEWTTIVDINSGKTGFEPVMRHTILQKVTNIRVKGYVLDI